MSTLSKVIMGAIIAAVIVAMLRNPAATTGIILAGGSASSGILGTLEGSTSTQKGTFKNGTTSIAYG